MKIFPKLEVDDVLTDGYCDWFCEDCAGLRFVRNYPDEPDYSECTICDNNISNSKCLKRSAYERICAAVDDINQAIGETGCFSHDD